MKNPRIEITEDDLHSKPLLRLKMLYAIPPGRPISRAFLIKKIKEKGLKPFDDRSQYPSDDTLYSLGWRDLAGLAKTKMFPGITRDDLIRIIQHKRENKNGSTDSAYDYISCH